MTDDVSKKFNIQIAAQLSGLSAHTIRAWEKRYQALTPSRMTNGRRLYLSSEIDRLIMLSRLTKMGTNISQIAHLSDEELKTSYQKLTQTKESPITYIRPKAELDIIETKAKLLSAVGDYKVDIISQLLSEAKSAAIGCTPSSSCISGKRACQRCFWS